MRFTILFTAKSSVHVPPPSLIHTLRLWLNIIRVFGNSDTGVKLCSSVNSSTRGEHSHEYPCLNTATPSVGLVWLFERRYLWVYSKGWLHPDAARLKF